MCLAFMIKEGQTFDFDMLCLIEHIMLKVLWLRLNKEVISSGHAYNQKYILYLNCRPICMKHINGMQEIQTDISLIGFSEMSHFICVALHLFFSATTQGNITQTWMISERERFQTQSVSDIIYDIIKAWFSWAILSMLASFLSKNRFPSLK